MAEPVMQKNYGSYESSLDVSAVNRVLLIWFLAVFGAYAVLPESDWTNLFVAFFVPGVLWLLIRNRNNQFFSFANVNRRVNIFAVTSVLLLSLLAEYGLSTFFGAFAPRQIDAIVLSQVPSTRAFLLALLTTGLIAPLVEEYLFRWVALRAFASVRSPLFAALLSAALFALAHGTLVYAVIVFPLGFILALFVLKMGQLWSAVAVHVVANVYALAITQFGATPESYAEVPVTPLMGIAGLAAALCALLLAVLWLGLPSRRNDVRGLLWSNSLVLFILPNLTFAILGTFIV